MIWLKSKIYWIGGALLTALAFFARFQMVKSQRDKAIQKKNELDAENRQIKRAKAKRKVEREKFLSRRVEARKSIEQGEVPRNLSDPNDF